MPRSGTQPVINVVQEWLDVLLDEFIPAHDLRTSFHRAVRLLAVFTAADERGASAHQPVTEART